MSKKWSFNATALSDISKLKSLNPILNAYHENTWYESGFSNFLLLERLQPKAIIDSSSFFSIQDEMQSIFHSRKFEKFVF